MTPYYAEPSLELYCGDALDTLAQLPAESMQTCVTSPPYFGLRDYGTAQWIGGDADCDHKSNRGKQGETGQRATRTFTAVVPFKEVCGKCGAARVDQQIGLESTPAEFVARLVAVFAEVRRVLKDDGTVWINLGDSYASQPGQRKPMDVAFSPKQQSNEGSIRVGSRSPVGFKPKDLIGIPWRVAFALQEDGWYLRQDIIWHKPAPMPESCKDRCTKAHEYLFLLSKSPKYYFDADAIAETGQGAPVDKVPGGWAVGARSHSVLDHNTPANHRKVNGGASFGKQKIDATGTGAQSRQYDRPVYDKRNKRSVWTVASAPYPSAHFATFPPKLIEPCILAGSRPGDTVLDPFNGSGTTGEVSRRFGRRYVGIELNAQYCDLTIDRLRQLVLFGSEAAMPP